VRLTTGLVGCVARELTTCLYERGHDCMDERGHDGMDERGHDCMDERGHDCMEFVKGKNIPWVNSRMSSPADSSNVVIFQ